MSPHYYGAWGDPRADEDSGLHTEPGSPGLGQVPEPGSYEDLYGDPAPTVHLGLEYDVDAPEPEYGKVRTAAIPLWVVLLIGTGWALNRYLGGGAR